MNRTLLNLLYIHMGGWEEHLQLLLYVYCTKKHWITGLSPHEVLFEYNIPSLHKNAPEVLNPTKYCDQLQEKLLE